MADKKKLTKEEAIKWLEVHMGQKDPAMLAETLEAYGSKEDCYFMGIFEGLINGFVLAGGELAKDFLEEESSENNDLNNVTND